MLAWSSERGAHDLRKTVDVDGPEPQTRLDSLAHRLAPRLGSEQADLERALAQVHALTFGQLGNREGVGRCRAQHARAKVRDQRNLALGGSARHRHDGSAESLRTV